MPTKVDSMPRIPSLWQNGSVRLCAYTIVIAIGLLSLFLLAKILLVIFAGILLAVLLRGLSDRLSFWTRFPVDLSLAIIVVAGIVVPGAIGYVVAPRASVEINQLFTRLTAEVHGMVAQLEKSAPGRTLVAALDPSTNIGKQGAVSRVFGVATTTVDVVAGTVVAVFVGFYLAADPTIYLTTALRLVPPLRRHRAERVLFEITGTLRRWLIGRFLSMALIGAMTIVGLWQLGIQFALILGALAGLMSFVPYVGSISSAIPSILVALTESTSLAVYVMLLYIGVHLLEGYVLVPLMQKRFVHLPPAITLVSQAIFGTLFGVLGLAVATPLAAAIITMTRMLYVEDILHDVQLTGAASTPD